ncbi:MAG: hypothetical protein WBA46_11470, partial [Thermomicrobiales bacterium]
DSQPDGGMKQLRTAVFRQMAESIRLAHGLNPDSWLVMYWNRRIILLVGAYYSFSPQATPDGHVDLLLQSPFPDDNLDVEETQFKLHRDFRRVRVPMLEMAKRFPDLRAAHHRAIVTAARSKPTYWRRHDERALAELEVIIGEPLPRPNYVDDPMFAQGVLDDVPWIVADRLATTIELAHRTNDRSWSFYKVQRSVVVPVADIPVARWRQRLGRIDLGVLLDDVPEPVLRRWEEHRVDDELLGGEAGTFWARGPMIYGFIEDFAEGHERLVERIAQDAALPLRTARRFDPVLLGILAEHAREHLAFPGYVSVPRVEP